MAGKPKARPKAVAARSYRKLPAKQKHRLLFLLPLVLLHTNTLLPSLGVHRQEAARVILHHIEIYIYIYTHLHTPLLRCPSTRSSSTGSRRPSRRERER